MELVDNPVPDNNRVGDTVYCAVPDPNGFYAIDIRSWTGENEKLNGLDIATVLNQEEQWTIDLIFRIDRPQFATLLHSSGFKLYTTYRMSGGVPDNAIAMHVGDMMLRWTKAQTIQPGRWHHLTVTADSISSSWFSGGSCYVKVFIDGEECELGGNGLDDAPKFGKWDPGLDVFPKVDGQFKLLRTCSKALSKSEIKPFQYVRRADGTLPADYLSEFAFDEGTKNKMVFSGDEESMEIITDNLERISAEHDGIWVKLQRLISGFQFVGQARVEETSENSYTITLPVGKYTVKANVGKTYETDYYRVTPAGGEFELVQGNLWRVAVAVQASGAALPGASVIVGETMLQSNTDGLAVWYLPAGQSYTITVRKVGYSDVTLVADLTVGKNLELSAELIPASIRLAYSVDGAGGRLVGPVNQMVMPGGTGQPVMAVPELGYTFWKWNDGTVGNPHVAAEVTENQEVVASFKEVTVHLAYRVGAGGRFKDGAKPEQNVRLGKHAEPVEVEPLDADHYFMGWSDGVESTSRRDSAQADVELTALFGECRPLPAYQDFEQGMDGWYTLSKDSYFQLWGVTRGSVVSMQPLQGLFAACTAYSGPGYKMLSYLYTPVYKLDAGWNDNLVVSMDYIAPEIFRNQYVLEMRTDGGEWTRIHGLLKASVPTFSKVIIPKADLAGKQQVQFRWYYKSDNAKTVALDNVVITKESVENLAIRYVAEPSEAGTFHKVLPDGTPEPAAITKQTVAKGSSPVDVVAVPAQPYEFVRWREGIGTARLAVQSEVYYGRTYTAIFRNPSQLTIAYRVMPPEAGIVEVDNAPAVSQTVNRGAGAKPAKAVAK